MPDLTVQRRYTRTDTRGRYPKMTGLPGIEHNRLAMFWRPAIDMTDSPLAPMRLRFIQPVSAWIAEPVAGRWSWFAMIGVAGQRHQVLRHAGLEEYDCREPTGLPEPLRTPQWSRLVSALERFAELDDYVRSLVVFQLVQLSYCEFVFRIAGLVRPNGDPAHDRYAYEVARAHARYPGHVRRALTVFEQLALECPDPALALLSSAQGIGWSIRDGGEIEVARRFAAHGARILAAGVPDTWHGGLVRSRFHRALALLRLSERDPAGMRRELEIAVAHAEELFAGLAPGIDYQVALENKRILLESQIKGAARARGSESAEQVRVFCEELHRIDPYCVEVRLVIGDGYATIGNYAEAAHWYAMAGELGTGAGASGWFRAGQCHHALGDRGAAANAMGRCLELDSTALEAREYLSEIAR